MNSRGEWVEKNLNLQTFCWNNYDRVLIDIFPSGKRKNIDLDPTWVVDANF